MNSGVPGAALLEVRDLCVSLGGAALIRGVSFAVNAGEVLGLVGASGSGKSLTALSLLRLLPAGASATGQILLRGEDLAAQSPARLRAVRGREIGMVFQEPMSALNPLMTIGEQVAETVQVHRAAAPAEARRLARAALDRVWLRGDAGDPDRYPHELSGGQRQRVAIAIAVVLSPALLIADEPTTALDAHTREQVLAVLFDLVRSAGMGLLLITHDMSLIARTDRVAVLHRGRIVEQAATAQLPDALRQPQARALIQAAQLEPRRTAGAAAGMGAAAAAPAAPDRAAAPVLELRDIVLDYPRRRRSLLQAPPALRAVDGVSLTVRAGETVGLVGESGAGKSSLLRVVLALARPQAGEVRLLGEPFAAHAGNSRRLRRAIQIVFQDPYGSFDPLWSVERLVAEPFALLAAPPEAAERRRRVAAMLELVGLRAADMRRRPREFSGGQRQRIAIARALIIEPRLIVFDEAVSALDVLLRAQILALLAELSARLELAYLFVSHDPAVVRAIADRVYVMQAGRIVEERLQRA
jgi:peptide/nickel transport system ATP-binding protein